jgi:hypothetical protein
MRGGRMVFENQPDIDLAAGQDYRPVDLFVSGGLVVGFAARSGRHREFAASWSGRSGHAGSNGCSQYVPPNSQSRLVQLDLGCATATIGADRGRPGK